MNMDTKGRVYSTEDHLVLAKAALQLATRVEFLRGRIFGFKGDSKLKRRLKATLKAYDAVAALVALDSDDTIDIELETE